MRNSKRKSSRGASLIETAIGLTFLIPIVLVLVDVVALVIAQTSNDAMAKHAAREAAAQSIPANQTSPSPTLLRQSAASSVVNAFNNSALADNATLVAYTEPQSGQICQVKTQVICNLPVAVPFGGPSSQTLESMAVEPITTTRATPTSGNTTPLKEANLPGNSKDDEGYLIMKSITTGQENPITEVSGAVVVPE